MWFQCAASSYSPAEILRGVLSTPAAPTEHQHPTATVLSVTIPHLQVASVACAEDQFSVLEAPDEEQLTSFLVPSPEDEYAADEAEALQFHL